MKTRKNNVVRGRIGETVLLVSIPVKKKKRPEKKKEQNVADVRKVQIAAVMIRNALAANRCVVRCSFEHAVEAAAAGTERSSEAETASSTRSTRIWRRQTQPEGFIA
jgi:hypothetical protein